MGEDIIGKSNKLTEPKGSLYELSKTVDLPEESERIETTTARQVFMAK